MKVVLVLKALSAPIGAGFELILAHWITASWEEGSDGHVHGDLGVGVVTLDLEVLESEILDGGHLPLDGDGGEGPGGARHLHLQRLHVVAGRFDCNS